MKKKKKVILVVAMLLLVINLFNVLVYTNKFYSNHYRRIGLLYMQKGDTTSAFKYIKKAIKYLRTKNPDKATREEAISLLRKMGDTAHEIAHDVVEKEEDSE